jgi:hypothetical protein
MTRIRAAAGTSRRTIGRPRTLPGRVLAKAIVYRGGLVLAAEMLWLTDVGDKS